MEIMIKAPKEFECDRKEWEAEYKVIGDGNARKVWIEARSTIEVIIAKVEEDWGLLGSQTNYYISSPNFNVAIPCIGSLKETFWITEKLVNLGMPAPDAVTVGQVLTNMGDF